MVCCIMQAHGNVCKHHYNLIKQVIMHTWAVIITSNLVDSKNNYSPVSYEYTNVIDSC